MALFLLSLVALNLFSCFYWYAAYVGRRQYKFQNNALVGFFWVPSVVSLLLYYYKIKLEHVPVDLLLTLFVVTSLPFLEAVAVYFWAFSKDPDGLWLMGLVVAFILWFIGGMFSALLNNLSYTSGILFGCYVFAAFAQFVGLVAIDIGPRSFFNRHKSGITLTYLALNVVVYVILLVLLEVTTPLWYV